MAGLVLAIAPVPDVASAEPAVAPPTTTAEDFELVKKLRPGLLPVDLLLAYRTSPPNFIVCLPFVQLSESPYVQSGVESWAVAVMLLPTETPVNPAAPPKQFPGGLAPVIGLQTGKAPAISGRT